MTFAIKVNGLTKRYGRILALKNVSLEVEEGEFFGLLGPNGAGKTTLIRILTGLTAPTSGEVMVAGGNPFEEPVKVKGRFGLVPEISNVYVDFTAWENLMFTGRLYSVPRDVREKRAMDLLEILGLKERRDSPVRQFSKGMRRRLAIAMALMHDPQILFLDEPTSGLDVQSTNVIRGILRRLNEEEGKTIFLTTHYIEEAEKLCHRVAILNRGEIVAQGTVDELKASIKMTEIVEVTFNASIPSLSELEKRCDKVVRLKENKIRLYSPHISRNIEAIMDFARRNGLEILSVNTLNPTLEDVFIRYTGLDIVAVERMEQIRAKGAER
ncbi:ATP-binding protein [Candidatus Bathyarchaeota archaeon]|nr:MAG: ATP-binding protein [Candidatus Bathyarchaeota archaeon]